MDQVPTKNRSQILKTHGNELLMITFGIIGLIVVALFFRSNFTGCDAFEQADAIAKCQQTIATHSGAGYSIYFYTAVRLMERIQGEKIRTDSKPAFVADR